MDAAQAALDAASAMPAKDECDGCHAAREAAIQAALSRIPDRAPGTQAVLAAGVVIYVAGLLVTSPRSIGAPAYPGLLIIMAGLVVAGPWLTAASARLLRVARNLADFRHDRPGDTLRGWLRVITRNALLTHHRRSRGR